MNEDEQGPAGEIDASGSTPAQKAARQQQQARKAAEREQRLKAQLRANLQRRKVQTRARREGEADERPGDLSAPRVER